MNTAQPRVKTIALIALLSSLCLASCPSDPTDGNVTAEGATTLSVSWARDPENPLIEGSGDISDVCDPSVLYDDGLWRLWASALSRSDGKAHICYSESRDGIAWDVPAIQFSPCRSGWDDQKVEVPSVIKDENETDPAKRYKMWYGGANGANPDLTKIGYAYSPDGRTWTRNAEDAGLALDLSDVNVYSDPAVIKVGETYHMWFNSFSETTENTLQIDYAVSDDGARWTLHSRNPAVSPGQPWEKGSHMPGNANDVVHPAVLRDEGSGLFMMYYGSFDATGHETYSGIGYAESADGLVWTKSASNPAFLPNAGSPGEENGISTGPAIVKVEGKYYLFYSAADKDYKRVICRAVSE